MKIFIFLTIFLFVADTSAQLSKQQIKEQVAGLKLLQKAEFEKVIEELNESRNTANGLADNLIQAQKQFNIVGQERDGWKAYGEDRNEKWLNAERRVAEEKVKKQRWVMMFSGLAILAALYFGLKFLTPFGKFIP